MIKPDMIPDEAWQAAMKTDPRDGLMAAIVAAINAWPKMTVDGETYKGVTDWHIHLPLKEYSDE